MTKHEDIEKNTEKKYGQKDKKKKPKMHMSGKSVFTLQKLIAKPHDSVPKRTNSKNHK